MSEQPQHQGTILIYTIHRVEPWFKYLGQQMGFEESVTFSDIRGDADISITDDFYAAYKRAYKASATTSSLVDQKAMTEIIARCRLLRWLQPRRAHAMVIAMAAVIDALVERISPRAVLSFPIDRYIMDILSRRAQARGIPYYEYTTAPFAGMSMLLHEGRLLTLDIEPDPATVEERRSELTDPLFKPPYVAKRTAYGKVKFLKTFGYFKLRGRFFQVLSWLKCDPLGLHYLDAQSFLGHKPRLSDIRYDQYIDPDWVDRLVDFPPQKRIAMPLALFPEASIDYWVRDLGLVDYENLLVEAAQAYSDSGFLVLVKDHPLQFGFRQLGLLKRLRKVKNLVVLPYEVSGNALLDAVDNCFVLTGTLGLQAAMLGKTAVVTDNYYTNEHDFVIYRSRDEIPALPRRTSAFRMKDPISEVQTRLVHDLLKGCFDGDYSTFRNFEPDNPSSGATELGRNMGAHVAALLEREKVEAAR